VGFGIERVEIGVCYGLHEVGSLNSEREIDRHSPRNPLHVFALNDHLPRRRRNSMMKASTLSSSYPRSKYTMPVITWNSALLVWAVSGGGA
jgi:hypothetical protein